MNPIFSELASWLDNNRNPRLGGWCSLEKAEALMMAALTIRPMVAVEIGVFAGRSVLPVALAMREAGQGVIHCIDPWSPEESAKGYNKANFYWWLKDADHQSAKKQFLQLIQECRLQNVVEIHQGKSDDIPIEQWHPSIVDLLHVDGQHTMQAKKDVARFACHVRIGGIVFMDDVNWQNEGRFEVNQAVQDLITLGFVKLYGCYGNGNDFETYQRIK